MDKVRFGRALGYGARHAAKSLQAAAAAASAPGSEPAATTRPLAANQTASGQPFPSAGQAAGQVAAQATGRAERQPVSRNPVSPAQPAAVNGVAQVQQILRGAAQVRAAQKQAGRHARRSFFGPLAKFSSVVSLQVTGTFFALIALIMAQAAWRSRAALQGVAGGGDPRRFYIVTGVALLFAYFALSNFLRARRRDRKS